MAPKLLLYDRQAKITTSSARRGGQANEPAPPFEEEESIEVPGPFRISSLSAILIPVFLTNTSSLQAIFKTAYQILFLVPKTYYLENTS